MCSHVGRPKVKRKRGVDEPCTQNSQKGKGVYKLSKKYITVTCSRCHNSRLCKGQGGTDDGAGTSKTDKQKGKHSCVYVSNEGRQDVGISNLN